RRSDAVDGLQEPGDLVPLDDLADLLVDVEQAAAKNGEVLGEVAHLEPIRGALLTPDRLLRRPDNCFGELEADAVRTLVDRQTSELPGAHARESRGGRKRGQGPR